MNNKALIGFAGFGGPDLVLREAGIETVGIELDPAIADVNRQNGGNVITSNILDIDPSDYTGWWLYHFSPPCPSFSIANQASDETELDIALAHKIAQFVSVGQPRFITIENVWLYQKSASWAIIKDAITEAGYSLDWWHLNAADYGVPQTRKRMIAIARRDGKQPAKPWPTHSKDGDMFTDPWVGWYEAIEDLIPDLPETEFANWQVKIMPSELRTWLVGHSSTNLTLVNVTNPAYTMTANSSKARAFIVNSDNANRQLTTRSSNEPTFSVMASDGRRPSSLPRAFIADSANSSAGTIRTQDDPMFTVTAGVASKIALHRAFVPGRVVSMTPRCLARFQSFPDWFQLPENRTLACKGIGNALPPGLYRAILKSLT